MCENCQAVKRAACTTGGGALAATDDAGLQTIGRILALLAPEDDGEAQAGDPQATVDAARAACATASEDTIGRALEMTESLGRALVLVHKMLLLIGIEHGAVEVAGAVTGEGETLDADEAQAAMTAGLLEVLLGTKPRRKGSRAERVIRDLLDTREREGGKNDPRWS